MNPGNLLEPSRNPVPLRGAPALDLDLGGRRLRSWMLTSSQTLHLKGWKGQSWITMEGDPEDHVLEEGQSLQFCGPGLLVAEAMDPAAIYDWCLDD